MSIIKHIKGLGPKIAIGQTIEGYLSMNEGILLYIFSKFDNKVKGEIVEIGSFMGRSTYWLALGQKESKKGKVVAIDPHKGDLGEFTVNNICVPDGGTFKKFKDNLKKREVLNFVSPMKMTSKTASKKFNKPIRFLFVDGDHKYEAVKMDIDLWSPKVVNGGIIAIHDSVNWDGPKKVVEEMKASGKYDNFVCVDSMTICRKK